MNFDRNTIIGFVLLALLFFGFFYFNNKQQIADLKDKARRDSLAKAKEPKPDTSLVKKDVVRIDSPKLAVQDTGAVFYQFAQGAEQLTVVENKFVRVAFTNKGGQPKSVELKNFRAPDSNNVHLSSTDFDKISYSINTRNNKTGDISDYYFTGGQALTNADSTQTVVYQLQAPDGRSITHKFTLGADYMIDFVVDINGVNQLLSGNTLYLTWQNKALQLQKDLNYEKQQSQICFNQNNDYDYYNIASRTTKEFTEPVKWLAVKQQFFNTTLIAKNGFSSGTIDWTRPDTSDHATVVQATAKMKLSLPNANHAEIPLAIYYGPTDYKVLKKYGNDMDNMVNLGSGVFSFVKYLNRWVIIPIFNLFSTFTSNFGIVILLLTLFIRLLISPLTYSSYLSGAKMKVLRPEIEKLKAKYGSDQQQISVEQMKLFREAGVNPLGGCIPALL